MSDSQRWPGGYQHCRRCLARRRQIRQLQRALALARLSETKAWESREALARQLDDVRVDSATARFVAPEGRGG